MHQEDRGGNPEIMAWVGKTHLAWKRFIQKGLVGEGLSLKQYYVLLQLDRNHQLEPALVAEMLYCDRPTASVILRNMEKSGWIRREKNPENRRHIHLTLTDAGREKLEHVRTLPSLQGRFRQNPMNCFSASEQAMFLKFMQTFHDHIQILIQEYENDVLN